MVKTQFLEAKMDKVTNGKELEYVKILIPELFPCGLPTIDGNTAYGIEEMDRVHAMCIKLGRYGICTQKMAGDCFTKISTEVVQ
jgi:hypothetical protein